MKINNPFKLIISVVICELAGIIGSFYTTPTITTWYATLPKPALNPPSWIFAPVWTTLFALMGIALFLVWRHFEKVEDNHKKSFIKIAFGVFALQLLLNVLWTSIFFGNHNPGGAFVEIVFLWLAILATIIIFSRISKATAWLLVPYILWVSFAGYLNYSIWQLSRIAEVLPQIPSSWLTATDQNTGISFQYPEKLTISVSNQTLAKYVRPVDWPPKVQVLNQTFGCTQGGSQIAQLGQTTEETINNRTYCVTKESEGAAGSIYNSYSYSSILAPNKMLTFTFTLQFPQCVNYDDPKMTECKNEEQSLDIDSIIDTMATSVK